jgi:uncharacterized tellurite resistance protein B-like protein
MIERIMGWFDAPDESDPGHREGGIQRAVCLLLVAVARADGSFAADEARLIARQVSEHFGLPPEETAELIALAAAEDQQDLFAPAHLLSERFPRQQRLEVLVLMWKVVFSDGKLEAREDALMHRVARLLNLTHDDLIAAKLTARAD